MSRLLGVKFEEHAREWASLADLRPTACSSTPGSILVTDLGRLMIRNIAMRFDAYLKYETERRTEDDMSGTTLIILILILP